MRARLLVVVAIAGLALAGGSSRADGAGPAQTCGTGFVHARLSWGAKCLRSGEFCTVSRDGEYHRYGFHCHTGARLSRRSTGIGRPSAGCQPGYSPCLPRAADLNCSDIPAAKRPVRVTGSDPYRLDGDRDGVACE